jgi:hypothetical protein
MVNIMWLYAGNRVHTGMQATSGSSEITYQYNEYIQGFNMDILQAIYSYVFRKVA